MSRRLIKILSLIILETEQMETKQTEAQEVPSEHEEELLPSEGDGALDQAAQGDCRLSFCNSRPAWTRSCAACCR